MSSVLCVLTDVLPGNGLTHSRYDSPLDVCRMCPECSLGVTRSGYRVFAARRNSLEA